MRPPALAIVGPGDTASSDHLRHAEALGSLAAAEGWTIITGGVASGVMEAASRGARSAGGLTVGILPAAHDHDASPALSVALVTGMGQARNNIIVLSSAAVAVCGMSPGTAAEVAIAVRARRPIVFIAADAATRAFVEQLGPAQQIRFADSPEDAVAIRRAWLAQQ
jgi:uncharacterized protein (TIGR00725 family)